jgi:hypothetical protein
MSTLFSNKTGRVSQPTGLPLILQSLQNHFNGSDTTSRADVARASLSLESIDTSMKSALSNSVDGLSNALESIVSELGMSGQYSAAQKNAAVVAGLAGGDIGAFLRHPVNPSVVANENMSIVGTPGLADAFTQRVGIEAFDEKENRNAVMYSVAYNMQAARQDDFGEAFFPTIVVAPDTFGYSVAIRLIRVYDDVQRSITGNLDKFNKRNIIRAFIDPTILKNDLTKMIPVYRSTQNADKFVDTTLIQARTLLLEGESIPTAPLAFGKSLSLLGLSQTDTLLANGVMDSTDSIDPAVALQTIYYKVGDDIISFNTLNLPLSVFSPQPQGLQRLMSLSFNTTSLMLNANSTRLDKSALTTLGAIVTNSYIVRLSVNVAGNVDLELANTEVFANGLKVVSVQDASGANLSLTAGPGLAISDLIAGAVALGYDLQAYRTNLNMRQRGQLIDTSYYSQLYPVPLRSPISALRPVSTDGATDSSDLAGLITTTRIRTSNAAVAALITAGNLLAEYVDARDSAGVGPDILGVGRHILKPVYFKETLDMLLSVDSISSHKRAADIQAALVSKIRDAAYRMYRDSGYKAAADAMAGGVAKQPTVIIGTDPLISRYLIVEGDLRTLGGDFDVKIVSSLDIRVQGKIYVTFGQFDGSENSPNPLHFGNMAWKPELTVVMPISRGGSTTKQLSVSPSFLHVVNSPVLTIIDVSNIPDVASLKVPVNFNAV